MCGIAGFFGRNTDSEKLKNIAAMIEMEKHRGPNDQGYFGVDFAGQKGREVKLGERIESLKTFDGYFGFCRLSIRDLSINGHQPMTDDEGKIVLVFNGEIYNADSYRSELEKRGYVFRSSTDTEVILNMYKEYGFYSMAEQLNGMFAIAIADLEKRRIYMARDRFGIKPLYYVYSETLFMFASEIKCFLPIKEFDRELDADAIQETIICGTSFQRSLFKNVKELQPGTIFEWDIENSPGIKSFFDIKSMRHPRKRKMPYKKYYNALKELLEKVVKSQTVSDVDIACQLSGGIDSSVISIIASDLEVNNMHDSVSIVFNESHEEYSEQKYIDIVNTKLQLSPHQSVLGQKYYMKNLKRAIWHLDTIPSFCNELGILALSETIAPYSTVLLSGEGADEVFGGYFSFLVGKCLGIYCRLPFKPLQQKFSRRYFMNGEVAFENFVVDGYGWTVTEELADEIFVDSKWSEIICERRKVVEELSGGSFEKQQKYQILTRLPGLLNRQDKMTMAFSLENRVPFLDNEILDFSYSLPEKYLLGIEWGNIGKKKVSIFQGKHILKRISSDIFGKDFSYRRKMGFDIPIRDYLQEPDFRACFYKEILPGIEKHRILNVDTIKSWYENIERMKDKQLMALWRCITMELWCGLFLEKEMTI